MSGINTDISEFFAERDRGIPAKSPKVKLTEAIIRKLPTKSYDYVIGEATVPSLFLRVRKDTGNKSFTIVRKVNGRMSRARVCSYGERPYSQGRESVIVKARALIAEMDAGITPSKRKSIVRKQAQEEAKLATTVKEACDAYIEAKNRARSTTKGYLAFRDRHLKHWHSRQLADISEDDIAWLHDQITSSTGPVAANNVVRFFRAIWKFHRRRLNLADSPTIIFTREGDNIRQWNPENRRTRYIAREELKAWWAATERLRREYVGDGDLAADFLQFALLTGLRRREITGIKPEDINLRRKTLFIPENKSKRPHAIPLTPALLEILNRRKELPRPFCIEEPKKFIKQVGEWCEIPFSSHDLRRTFLSHATAAGIPLPMQKALVNHSRNADVTDGYIQIDEDELRRGFEKVQQYILTHAEQVRNVAPLRGVSNG